MTVYVLGLTRGRFFVGFSNNYKKTIKNHFKKKEAFWTRLYKPISLEKVHHDAEKQDVTRYTLEYMKKYGVDHARGEPYTNVILSDAEEAEIKKLLKTL